MGTNVFKLNGDGKYQIAGYIKSDEEIDKETFAKIKAIYPDEPISNLSLEIKMLRIGIANPTDVLFVAYNNFVNQCRAEGQAAKIANAEKLAALKKVEIGENIMPTKIMVVS